MAEKYPTKMCKQCADWDVNKASLHCKNCKLDLCMRCVEGHKKIPSCVSHNYVNCDFKPKKPKTSPEDAQDFVKILEKKIKKDINNEVAAGAMCKPTPQDVIKIISSATTLQNMIGNLNVSGGSKAPWMLRHIKGSISDILGRIKHVKSIEKLTKDPYRLALVCDQLWIRCGKRGSETIPVFNQKLEKIDEIKHAHSKYIHTVQQVNDSDVMVTCGIDGLHLLDTSGQYLYKVMSGDFTDVTTDGSRVAVVDRKKNKVIFLKKKKDDKWQQESQFTVDDKDHDYVKTLHLINDTVYICCYGSDSLYQYSCSGGLLQRYGRVQEGSQLGQFDGPLISGTDSNQSLVICDPGNHRFQILDTQGQWTQATLTRIQYPRDLLVAGNCLFILHGLSDNVKVSKYSIPAVQTM